MWFKLLNIKRLIQLSGGSYRTSRKLPTCFVEYSPTDCIDPGKKATKIASVVDAIPNFRYLLGLVDCLEASRPPGSLFEMGQRWPQLNLVVEAIRPPLSGPVMQRGHAGFRTNL